MPLDHRRTISICVLACALHACAPGTLTSEGGDARQGPDPSSSGDPGDPDVGLPIDSGDAGVPVPDGEVSIPDASVPDPVDPPPPPPPPGDCDPQTAGPLPAHALRVSRLAVNQGVSVTVVENGQGNTSPTAPIVGGRDALVRVFVEPTAGWEPREVIARLTVGGSAHETQMLVSGASVGATLSTTLNFDIPGNQLSPGTQFSVALLEADPCGSFSGNQTDARFPPTQTAPLGVSGGPDLFRIVLVPVRYDTDGSGQTPNVDAATVNRFRDRMYAMFPLAEFDVTVRNAPLAFSSPIRADGGGWSQLLDACLALRDTDNADPNTYYYCAVQPTADPFAFCGNGCVAGLGPVPVSADTYNRASIGLLYSDGRDTFVHEVGHTLGLPHAPCGGVAGADPNFPHNDGRTGVLGFDIVTETQFSADHRDVMGYCDPVWISDYNYDKLYTRLSTVTAQSARLRKADGALQTYRSLVIDIDGSLSVGVASTRSQPPMGDPIDVTFISNGVVRTVSGTFVSVSHIDGGIVYVPEPTDVPDEVRVAGHGSVSWR